MSTKRLYRKGCYLCVADQANPSSLMLCQTCQVVTTNSKMIPVLWLKPAEQDGIFKQSFKSDIPINNNILGEVTVTVKGKEVIVEKSEEDRLKVLANKLVQKEEIASKSKVKENVVEVALQELRLKMLANKMKEDEKKTSSEDKNIVDLAVHKKPDQPCNEHEKVEQEDVEVKGKEVIVEKSEEDRLKVLANKLVQKEEVASKSKVKESIAEAALQELRLKILAKQMEGDEKKTSSEDKNIVDLAVHKKPDQPCSEHEREKVEQEDVEVNGKEVIVEKSEEDRLKVLANKLVHNEEMASKSKVKESIAEDALQELRLKMLAKQMEGDEKKTLSADKNIVDLAVHKKPDQPCSEHEREKVEQEDVEVDNDAKVEVEELNIPKYVVDKVDGQLFVSFETFTDMLIYTESENISIEGSDPDSDISNAQTTKLKTFVHLDRLRRSSTKTNMSEMDQMCVQRNPRKVVKSMNKFQHGGNVLGRNRQAKIQALGIIKEQTDAPQKFVDDFGKFADDIDKVVDVEMGDEFNKENVYCLVKNTRKRCGSCEGCRTPNSGELRLQGN